VGGEDLALEEEDLQWAPDGVCHPETAGQAARDVIAEGLDWI
jgi:hypothetical protein